MAESQLHQVIAEKGSGAALAYQSNLLFQNLNHFMEKRAIFLLKQ